MQHNRICPHCGGTIGSEFIQFDRESNINGETEPFHCYHCDKPFSLVQEGTVRIEGVETTNFPTILPVLEKGEIVQLINEDHPWNNEICLICDTGHKRYRLEIRGQRLWVPEEWVRKTDELFADSD